MILQALVQHYEDLLALGEISRPGWGKAKVSYGLELADDGTLLSLIPLETEQLRGNKTVLAAQEREVPMPVKRTVGISANFLCDNSGYLLGADAKGKPKRTAQCFAACRELHETVLAGVQSAAGQAVLAFFARWQPEAAASHPALAPYWEALMKGGNLIFWHRYRPVFDDPEVRARWQAHYDGKAGEGEIRCLVTGQKAAPEEIHPAIKGVRGAQSSGAALVSFNAPAFWSYDREYGENAPISGYAAFAYTTALNHLLADRDHVQVIGDTTVVCWAMGGQSAYQDCGLEMLNSDTDTERDLLDTLRKLAKGQKVEWDDTLLDPDMTFYVLGLSPNAARLSVRFFWQNSFGAFTRNILAHYERLEMIRPAYEKRPRLSIGSILWETVNRKASRPEPPHQLAGSLLLSILNNTAYPATLLNNVMLRIRAEKEISWGRASIVKAYYLRNTNSNCPEEILMEKCNEQSSYMPYVLGRLFAVLEALQRAANPDINTTIKDRYFNAASTMPEMVFPTILRLAQNHLKKLKDGQKIYYDKQITELMARITETYPARMDLPEQGAFQIGYYHQVQKNYTKKEDK